MLSSSREACKNIYKIRRYTREEMHKPYIQNIMAISFLYNQIHIKLAHIHVILFKDEMLNQNKQEKKYGKGIFGSKIIIKELRAATHTKKRTEKT